MSSARPRPLLRTLADGLVFLAVLAMLGLALRQSGLQSVPRGSYMAVDGDSLRRDAEDFRLHGIDAPELHQSCETAAGRPYPCGREARGALRSLVSGQNLDCRVLDIDRYDRSVVACQAGEQSLNAEMVRRGWAIAYRRHGRQYITEEGAARAARRGLWQGRFDNPEDWRARHRGAGLRGGITGGDD